MSTGSEAVAVDVGPADPLQAPPVSVGGAIRRLGVDTDPTQEDVLSALVTVISMYFTGDRVVGVRPTEGMVTTRVV